jgi:hypothetical protein
MEWRRGSSGRVPALHAQSSECKLQSPPTKQKKQNRRYLTKLKVNCLNLLLKLDKFLAILLIEKERKHKSSVSEINERVFSESLWASKKY